MRMPLDRQSSVPLYRQVQHYLRSEIISGVLVPETRLPPSRELATDLGISRIVVLNAYAELESEGLVYSRGRSGLYVSAPLEDGRRLSPVSGQDWPLWQQELLSRSWQPACLELARRLDTFSRPHSISFAIETLDAALTPPEGLRKTLSAVTRREGVTAIRQTYDRSGYPPLRGVLANLLSSQGVPTRPDDVLVTGGSQQGISLVARLLLAPGDIVLVESPTYDFAIDLFRSLDIRMLGVPVDGEGMQVELVEDALCTAHPRLIYTIPTFHNPTGTTMSDERRRALVALAGRYNVPILEDDYIPDLRYEGRSVPALKALDSGGQVIYLSSFSKTLSLGLRLGFLVAHGPVRDRLLAAKFVSDLETSGLTQRLLTEYVTVGHYQIHIRRLRQVFLRRRDAMLAALRRYLPAGAHWMRPLGGCYIWLQLPDGLSANDLFPVAAEAGVLMVPGSHFFPGGGPQSHVRLNFTLQPPERIEEGIKRLGRAVGRLLAARK